MKKKPSGPCSARFKPGDICRVCAWRRRRPGNRECEECIARERRRGEDPTRLPGRRAGRDRMVGKPGECTRCTALALPGKDVCEGHHATLMELMEERE